MSRKVIQKVVRKITCSHPVLFTLNATKSAYDNKQSCEKSFPSNANKRKTRNSVRGGSGNSSVGFSRKVPNGHYRDMHTA